jgi:hypothetical protein
LNQEEKRRPSQVLSGPAFAEAWEGISRPGQAFEAATFVRCIDRTRRMAALVADVPAIHMSDHRAKFKSYDAVRASNNVLHLSQQPSGASSDPYSGDRFSSSLRITFRLESASLIAFLSSGVPPCLSKHNRLSSSLLSLASRNRSTLPIGRHAQKRSISCSRMSRIKVCARGGRSGFLRDGSSVFLAQRTRRRDGENNATILLPVWRAKELY